MMQESCQFRHFGDFKMTRYQLEVIEILCVPMYPKSYRTQIWVWHLKCCWFCEIMSKSVVIVKKKDILNTGFARCVLGLLLHGTLLCVTSHHMAASFHHTASKEIHSISYFTDSILCITYDSIPSSIWDFSTQRCALLSVNSFEDWIDTWNVSNPCQMIAESRDKYKPVCNVKHSFWNLEILKGCFTV